MISFKEYILNQLKPKWKGCCICGEDTYDIVFNTKDFEIRFCIRCAKELYEMLNRIFEILNINPEMNKLNSWSAVTGENLEVPSDPETWTTQWKNIY